MTNVFGENDSRAIPLIVYIDGANVIKDGDFNNKKHYEKGKRKE